MTVRKRVRNSKGFSLIEMMVAIVFIMISMLALLTASLTTMQTNMKNELRNIAITISNQTAEVLLALPEDDTEVTDGSVHSRIAGDTTQDAKGFPFKKHSVRSYQQEYDIQWDVVSKTDKIKQVTITVTYTFKNKNYSTSSVIYKNKAV
ncbi:MAG TPA: hypothetical protein DCO77_01100 [Nitrospiraceae bacterium]|nr:hypothetical protein [Nitrospiraceae bacterium]